MPETSPPTDPSSSAPQRGLAARLRGLLSPRRNGVDGAEALREAVEGYIEDSPESGAAPEAPAQAHERALLANILRLRDLTAADVMVPRADIVAIDRAAPPEALLALFADKRYSRMPVYSGTLDDVAGVVHMKDVLAALAAGAAPRVDDLIRPAPIVAPTLPVGNLLLDMRRSRRHMALVVDEFGGIDGLVTIGDLIEAIVGDIADEHDHDADAPSMELGPGGAVLADARVEVEDFEARFGRVLTDEERAECDTLGGLVFFLAGRVPARGEVLTHPASGAVFEVAEADARRVGRLRITGLGAPDTALAEE